MATSTTISAIDGGLDLHFREKYGCHLVKLIFHTSKILKLNRKIRYLQISTGLNK